ncbi:MAG: nucleotidyltransferase domain-containing protein [Gammaproteobacteria bacterium]|nr:MAG: nucleotidyltransferase domain-containing protein [Gammaproteobacteria bacterium]
MKFGLEDKALAMLIDTFRKHPEIERVQVFGSRAMGNYRPNSDIDLVLWGQIDEGLLGVVNSELDELPLPYKFDVKFYADITHEAFRQHIDTYGRDLYVRSAG